MANIIDEISNLFLKFERQSFEIHQNDDLELNVVFKEHLDSEYYSIADRFKQIIRELHLAGNDISLKRIDAQIDKVINEQTNLKLDVDLVLRMEGEENYTIIESEELMKITKMKLEYLLNIKEYCGEFLIEGITNNSKDKLTHKQQILLLNQLGFFELPFYNNLSTINKGKLVSNLLNRTEKDSLEIVRGLKGKPDDKYKTNTHSNKETVNKLLKDLGLTECLFK